MSVFDDENSPMLSIMELCTAVCDKLPTDKQLFDRW